MFTRYSPVRHSLRSEDLCSFDLHGLGTPPAFVLSQDQTLSLKLAQYSQVLSLLTQTNRLDFFLSDLSIRRVCLFVLCSFQGALPLSRQPSYSITPSSPLSIPFFISFFGIAVWPERHPPFSGERALFYHRNIRISTLIPIMFPFNVRIFMKYFRLLKI